MEKSGWAFAQCGNGERYHHRFCQEGQVSADQRRTFHGCTCAGLSCLWSHQRISLSCRWHSQPIFRVRCDHVLLQLDHSNTHMKNHHVTLAQDFGTQIKFCLPAVCCLVTGYLRTKSQNVLRPGCGKAVVSMIVPTTICWWPLTDREASVTFQKHMRKVAFGVATFSVHILRDTSFKLQRIGFLGGQVPGRQTVHESSFGETSKSSAESTKRRTSKFP